jgi:hypothetical protein
LPAFHSGFEALRLHVAAIRNSLKLDVAALGRFGCNLSAPKCSRVKFLRLLGYRFFKRMIQLRQKI